MTEATPTAQLSEAGVSIWLDDLSRERIQSGGLQKLIDESQPMVDARLADGSRVNAAIAPIAIDGAAVSIRKFSKKPLTLEKLVGLGAMPMCVADFMHGAVKARVSIEAGLDLTWRKYVGDHGRSVSIEHFGASADYKTLFREFGITTEAVVAAAKDSLASL